MGTTSPKAVIMDETAVNRAMTRIAHEILERNEGCEDLALVGIVTRGDLLAKKLAEEIKEIEGVEVPLGSLDISFYRDDYATNFAPAIHATNIPFSVDGKRVVLVDDSIVRGTTSARIIKLLRDAGAKEVHFRVSAPPFKYPCYFGTDIPDQKLLVATGRNVEQINEIIGADTLGYLSTEHVVQLAKNAKCGFCTACFTGEYAVRPEEVLSTDIHERHLNDRPKNEKKLGE